MGSTNNKEANENLENNKEDKEMTEATKDVNVGAFISSLKRNNRQIREDRATAIGEEAQITYKRTIEDLELYIKRMQRAQENMLDLSPDNALSLIVADKFDSRKYTDEDVEIGIKIRNAEIKLEIAKKRYKYLFGGE